MTSPRSPGNVEASRRLDVNFQVARRRIEALTHHPKMIRARALAAYVGVFDFADKNGVVEASSEEIAAEFEIGRPSWLHYRAVLEEAGLLEVDALRSGRRRGFRLLPTTGARVHAKEMVRENRLR